MNTFLGKQSLRASIVTLIAIVAALLLCAPPAHAAESGALAAGDPGLEAQASGIEYECADVAKGKVTWNKKTKTVTMTNATINLDKQSKNYVYYGIRIDGASVYPTPTVTLKLVGTNTIKGGGTSLSAAIYTNEANLKIVGPGTLNTQCAGASHGIYVGGSLTAASGTITAAGSNNGVYADGKMTLSGATMLLKDNRYNGLRAQKGISLNKGKLTVDGAKTYGVSSDKNIVVNGAKVSVADVESTAVDSYMGAITVKKGTLTVKSSGSGIYCKKAFTVSGAKAKVSVSGLDYIGIHCGDYNMSKGKVSIAGCSSGVYSGSGAFKMSGGTLSATKCSSTPISTYGGTVKITGGLVTAKTTSDNMDAINSSKSISNKPACLKAIVGTLGKGATFKTGGNTYKVTAFKNVTLKTYGSSAKTPNVNEVDYGKVTYRVTGIGTKAFANAKGRAITSITLGDNIESIGANAFNGTAKLAKMNMQFYYGISKMNKNAFANCGKKGGAGLTVKCKYDWQADSVREAFTKAGMSKSVTYK